jgi:hypothetical protein
VTGGDTECKDFTSQDEKKQNDEVSKMLRDKKGAEPATVEVDGTRLSALAYCQTLGKPDSKPPRAYERLRALPSQRDETFVRRRSGPTSAMSPTATKNLPSHRADSCAADAIEK